MNKSLDLLQLQEVMNLNPRERKLVLALISGLSESNAMRAAGYSEKTIRAGTGRICHKNRVERSVSAAMICAGITPEKIARRLNEGIDLQDPEMTGVYATRHKYLETALRIGGHEPSKEVEVQESYEDRILRIKGEIEGK